MVCDNLNKSNQITHIACLEEISKQNTGDLAILPMNYGENQLASNAVAYTVTDSGINV